MIIFDLFYDYICDITASRGGKLIFDLYNHLQLIM